MERVRLFLRLRDKLKGKRKAGEAVTPVSPTQPRCAIPESVKLDDKERGIASKVLRLIRQKIPMNKEAPTGGKPADGSDDSSSNSVTSPMSDKSMIKSSPSFDLLNRQKSKSDQNLSIADEVLDSLTLKRSLSGSRLNQLNLLVPEVCYQSGESDQFRFRKNVSVSWFRRRDG